MGTKPQTVQEVDESNKICTAPNIITLLRCLLIPLFLCLEFGLHNELAALIVFAIASCTDWIDGQVARRTHQVSRLGKVFDPLVDRLLLAAGVIAVCLLGRCPLWIVVFLIVRDLILVCAGRFLLASVGAIVPVIYVGKFATAFLMFGYAFLLLGMPSTPALGWMSSTLSWLPGFGPDSVLLGIWLVYIGMVLSSIAFVIYLVRGTNMYLDRKHTS